MLRPSVPSKIAVLTFVLASCRSGGSATSNTSSAPASREATPVAIDAGTAPVRVTWDLNHVLVTGQSLAIGTMGIPPLTKEQPFENVMFDTGVMIGEDTPKKLVPLVEGDLIPGRVYRVETLASGFANLLGPNHRALVSIHGLGATTYAGLKMGTKEYNASLAAVKLARDLQRAENKSYVVSAILNVHGESDHVERTARYAELLAEWQRDYERDVTALTAQADPIPFFITQVSSFTRYGDTTSKIPHEQLAAHVASPGKVILVGPKYHLKYGGDGIHLANEGYRQLGEDYAKAYRRVVLERRAWEPLRPKELTRSGTSITIRFHVPAPPLVLDTTLVKDPGSYGFSYTDDDPSPPAITEVKLAGPDVVTLTLASSVDARRSPRVRYAFAGTKGANAGPTSGARGNLRDSDATPSRHGYPLYNWCVHFEAPVP